MIRFSWLHIMAVVRDALLWLEDFVVVQEVRAGKL